MAVQEINLGTLSQGSTKPAQRHSVSSAEPYDTYSFRLTETSNINLSLAGMSANARLDLYRDINGNRRIDSNERATPVASSNRSSANGDESINLANQSAGNYIAEVRRVSGTTSYDLRLSANAFSQSSNLLPAEVNVGVLSSFGRNNSVSNGDTSDTYRFNVNSAGDFQFDLSGLTGDADLRLIRDWNGNRVVDSGEQLGMSSNGGTSEDSLTLSLEPGAYFAQVYQFSSGNIDYNLTMSRVS